MSRSFPVSGRSVISGGRGLTKSTSSANILQSHEFLFAPEDYNGNTSNLVDSVNGYTVSTTGTNINGVSSGINGVTAYDVPNGVGLYDGAVLNSTISPPYTFMAVTNDTTVDNNGNGRYALASFTNDSSYSPAFRLQPGKSRVVMNISDSFTYTGNPNPPSGPSIWTAHFEDSNSYIRLNKNSKVYIGNYNTLAAEAINLFYATFHGGYIGNIELHDGSPTNGESTRIQTLADKYGITV